MATSQARRSEFKYGFKYRRQPVVTCEYSGQYHVFKSPNFFTRFIQQTRLHTVNPEARAPSRLYTFPFLCRCGGSQVRYAPFSNLSPQYPWRSVELHLRLGYAGEAQSPVSELSPDVMFRCIDPLCHRLDDLYIKAIRCPCLSIPFHYLIYMMLYVVSW
jgi:hypothetical protein